MADKQAWNSPSPQALELIRGVSANMLEDPSPIFDLVDKAVLDAAPERAISDPGLSEAMATVNHINLRHWIASNAVAPGERVPANLAPEVLDLARDIVRRGFDDTVLNGYRVGQNAAFQFLMDWTFELSDDPKLIHELLSVTSRSIFAFVDDTLAGIQELIDRERDQLTRGTHAERLEVVNLILEGAPITVDRAISRLGYDLRALHRAAVIWSSDAAPAGGVERLAEALARASGARRPFTVVASVRSLWVWIVPDGEITDEQIRQRLPAVEGVRVALGAPAEGLAGFRRSHLDALATQRLMQRMPVETAVASYREVEVVALSTSDEQRAAEFVQRRLGDLLDADPLLAETLRIYLREQFNASATARALFAHRNTVINRLERARELLPAPLEARGLEIGLALEMQHWLGAEAT